MRHKVEFGGGEASAWMDCRGVLGVYAGHCDEFRDKWGGEQTYSSRSGLSGRGWIGPRRPITSVSTYRTDVCRPENWISGLDAPLVPMPDGQFWRVFVPICRDGLARDYPAVLVRWGDDSTGWLVMAVSCFSRNLFDCYPAIDNEAWTTHVMGYDVHPAGRIRREFRWSHRNTSGGPAKVDLLKFIAALPSVQRQFGYGWTVCATPGPCCRTEDIDGDEYDWLGCLGIRDTEQGYWILRGRYGEVAESVSLLREFSAFRHRGESLGSYSAVDFDLPENEFVFWRFADNIVDAIRFVFTENSPFIYRKFVDFLEFDRLQNWEDKETEAA